MRKSKFSKTQIVGILKDAEAGVAVCHLRYAAALAPSTGAPNRLPWCTTPLRAESLP